MSVFIQKLENVLGRCYRIYLSLGECGTMGVPMQIDRVKTPSILNFMETSYRYMIILGFESHCASNF